MPQKTDAKHPRARTLAALLRRVATPIHNALPETAGRRLLVLGIPALILLGLSIHTYDPKITWAMKGYVFIATLLLLTHPENDMNARHYQNNDER